MKRSPLLKVTALVKKKADLSFEEFDKYWTEKHGPLLNSLPGFRESAVSYKQVHLDRKTMNLEGETLTPDYDGIMEVYAVDLDHIMTFLNSEDYKNIIIPDEAKFIDRTATKLYFGTEETHYESAS